MTIVPVRKLVPESTRAESAGLPDPPETGP